MGKGTEHTPGGQVKKLRKTHSETYQGDTETGAESADVATTLTVL